MSLSRMGISLRFPVRKPRSGFLFLRGRISDCDNLRGHRPPACPGSNESETQGTMSEEEFNETIRSNFNSLVKAAESILSCEERQRRTRKGSRLWPYHCEFCWGWHLTSKSPDEQIQSGYCAKLK